ncbi:heme exporter protein CcmD [Maricaulaceae bacterium MS644]
MSAYLAMDGYGAFVWPAYGLTLLGVGGLVFWTLQARRAASARLARLQALETAAKEALSTEPAGTGIDA